MRADERTEPQGPRLSCRCNRDRHASELNRQSHAWNPREEHLRPRRHRGAGAYKCPPPRSAQAHERLDAAARRVPRVDSEGSRCEGRKRAAPNPKIRGLNWIIQMWHRCRGVGTGPRGIRRGRHPPTVYANDDLDESQRWADRIWHGCRGRG